MDEDGFWAIIQKCHDAAPRDMNRKGELVRQEIDRLAPADAADFRRHFEMARMRANDFHLWGAAYVINGGCGDDTFDDFRTSLISRGRDAFERAVADPDSLAAEEIDPEMWFYEQSMRNYQNPALAVRERAEFRGAQRQSRIASRQWYGISNARPRAGTDPLHSDYGQTWSSGDGYHPLRWSGGATTVVVRPEVGRAY